MNQSDFLTDLKLLSSRQSVEDNCGVVVSFPIKSTKIFLFQKHVLLTADKISPASVVESVSDPSCGAVATFFGGFALFLFI